MSLNLEVAGWLESEQAMNEILESDRIHGSEFTTFLKKHPVVRTY
ncbi:hypothetical protein [Coleofasciculus sp. FACHB-SPT9]|nr:hypothetical protein [Coleofasciculus sp. FACHB-SPT9]